MWVSKFDPKQKNLDPKQKDLDPKRKHLDPTRKNLDPTQKNPEVRSLGLLHVSQIFRQLVPMRGKRQRQPKSQRTAYYIHE